MEFTEFSDPGVMESRMYDLLGEALNSGLSTKPYGVMVTGGSTPLPVYYGLLNADIEAGPDVCVTLSDERYVPPGTDGHNYTRIKPVLENLQLPEERRIYPDTALPINESVANFDQQLAASEEAFPVKFAMLGLGDDGHIAGLFSDQDVAAGAGRHAVRVARPDGREGISVSADFLRRIEHIVFYVRGAHKRKAIEQLRVSPEALIIGRVLADHERVDVWYSDL